MGEVGLESDNGGSGGSPGLTYWSHGRSSETNRGSNDGDQVGRVTFVR